MGDPPAPISIVYFSPRSGSTLMCRMFEATGKCVCFSEPSVLQDISLHKSKRMSPERFFKTALCLLFKPVHGMEVAHYMAKIVPGIDMCRKSEIEAAIPKIKFLFQYRDIIECTESVANIASAMPLAVVLLGLDRLIPYYCRKFLSKWFLTASTHFNPEQAKILTREYIKTHNVILMQAFQIQVLAYHSVLQMIEEDNDIPAVKCEHLVANPRRCLEAIFGHCGVSKDLIEPALEALNEDSQKNSVLSKAKVSQAQKGSSD
jgi:hypothetical protein